MKITPNTVSLIKGMTAQCVIEDVPESEVFEWQVSYNVTDKVTASVDSSHILTLEGVDAGSVVVTVSYVTPSDTITAVCNATVVDVPQFEDITADGSGSDDATIFARQYIINNNLKRISTFSDSIETTMNSIRTLCIVNTALTLADLGTALADLAIIKDAIQNLPSSAGKNTVNI